jgi:hypothetical protein
VHDRRAVGGPRLWLAIEVMVEDRGDALVGERADLEGAERDRFGARRIEAAERRSTPRQVRKPCSGCGRLARMAMISPSVLGPMARA